jgi:anti-sigma-K factor RskA
MAQLNDKDREELVAYLDGELEGVRARDLEARMNRDPRVRAEVAAFRKTWELLDFLPRAEPSPRFTHRTMERLTARTPATTMVPSGGKRRWPGWMIGVGWAAAVLLAASAGYAGFSYLSRPATPQIQPGIDTDPSDLLAWMGKDEVDHELVRNMRLLENKRLYENVDDIELLHRLDHPDLFGEVEVD